MSSCICLDNSFQKTYYEILSVKEDASYDQIRASYKASILDCHPDKLQLKLDSFSSCNELNERFLKVQKAWEILSDSKSRAVYDKELKASRLDIEVADDVQLEEMMMEEESGEVFELFYQCRCGDYISLSSDELSHMGFTFQGRGKKKPNFELAQTAVRLERNDRGRAFGKCYCELAKNVCPCPVSVDP